MYTSVKIYRQDPFIVQLLFYNKIKIRKRAYTRERGIIMYNRHIIVDFEMNPVDGKREDAHLLPKNEIIQIGAIKLNEEYNVVDRFNAYVCPQLNSKVTRHITKITGITTEMVVNAGTLEDVLKAFSEWMGEERLRIYAWSENDLQQLKEECAFKGIQIPDNMRQWLDFQAVYGVLTRLSRKGRKISLTAAAERFCIDVDRQSLHNALYDAELTTKLLVPFLNGEYIALMELYRVNTKPEPMTQTIGDRWGDMLRQFAAQTC